MMKGNNQRNRCFDGENVKAPKDITIPKKGKCMIETGIVFKLNKGSVVVTTRPIDSIRTEFQFMDALRNNPAKCELAVTLFNDTDSVKHIPSGTVLGKIGWLK